jgi:hypothetical protein
MLSAAATMDSAFGTHRWMIISPRTVVQIFISTLWPLVRNMLLIGRKLWILIDIDEQELKSATSLNNASSESSKKEEPVPVTLRSWLDCSYTQ